MTEKKHDYDAIWTDVYGDHQQIGPVHNHLRRIMGKTLDSISYESVLEIGCGNGLNHRLLTDGRGVRRYTGVDISPLAIDRAHAAVGDDFRLLDIQAGALPETWDLVFCSLVLEHLIDDEAALANMRAMTGRYLLASTIGGDFARHRTWEEMLGHVRNYTRGDLEAKLARAGFRIEKSIWWGFPFYSPLQRYLHDLFPRRAAGDITLPGRLAAKIIYGLQYLNSSKRGDLAIVLARPV